MRDKFDGDYASFRGDYFSMLEGSGLGSGLIRVSQDDLIAALYRHARFGHVEPRFEGLLSSGPQGGTVSPSDYEPDFVNKVRDHAMVESVSFMEANPAFVQEFRQALPDPRPINVPSPTGIPVLEF